MPIPARPRLRVVAIGLFVAALLPVDLAAAPAAPSKPTPAQPATTPPAPTATEPAGGEPEPAPEPSEPDPEPSPGEPEPAPEPTAPARVDPAALAAIQAEARALQDDLFKARARVSIVTSKLFRSRIGVQLRSNLERFYEVSDLVIALDGAPVFTQAAGVPTAADDIVSVYAAPGAHELTISARLVARRDATYKLRIDDTFTVLVPEDGTVSTRIVVRETGNMWQFTRRGRGHHAVTTTVRARARPNAKGGARTRTADR